MASLHIGLSGQCVKLSYESFLGSYLDRLSSQYQAVLITVTYYDQLEESFC